MRSRQSLGRNHGLAQDLVAKLGLQRGRRDQVDLVTKNLTQLTLQANEFEQTDGPAEFNEEVNVTIQSTFIAGK